MSKSKLALYLLIILLAIFLRVYRLDLNLPNLYSDEVDLHYKTNFWTQSPEKGIHDRLFYGVYTYTWFLGLTPLGVRLPSALYVTISIILLYFFSELISKSLKKNEIITIITILFGAILPWSLLISRIGFSHISLVLLIVLVHLILYLRAENFKGYLISIIPLILAAYYYQSLIIIAPFIFLLIFFQILKGKKRNIVLYLLLAFLSMIVIVLIFLFKPNYSDVSVGERGLDLAIWRDVNVTSDTNYYRGLSRLSSPTLFSLNLNTENFGNNIFYNFQSAVLDKFVTNYLSFFSLDFLFLKGAPVLRHSTGQVGAFLPFLLPFMIYGAYLIVRFGNSKIKWIFLVWILTSPIASSLAKDGAGDLIRVVTMMPFLTYLCALGIVESVKLIGTKLRIPYILIIIAIGVYSTYSFLFGYFHVYPAMAAKDYDFGFKEISDFQVRENSKSILLIWDGYYPHWHFRFWQNTPTDQYFNFKPNEIKINKSIFHQRFNNLYFSLPEKEEDITAFLSEEKISYISLPAHLSERYKYLLSKYEIIDMIYYPDKSLAFYILFNLK